MRRNEVGGEDRAMQVSLYVNRYVIGALVIAGAAAILPLVGHGAATSAQPRSSTQASKAGEGRKDTTHATTGVVKSVAGRALVITRVSRPGEELRFEVSPFAHREGTVEVGSPVSVRYREDGSTHVATAITVQPMRHQAPADGVRPVR